MKQISIFLTVMSITLNTFASVDDSILPLMDEIYTYDFGNKVNQHQKEMMQSAIQKKEQRLRIMTYNMLYNAKDAEDKLQPEHRWENRKPRLFEYLSFAKADIIGSQELQDDQVQEVMNVIGSNYGYYGEKTRQNEGRTDTNAIFFNKNRVELIESKTIPFQDEKCENAFTYCLFKDKQTGKQFVVLNTKLSWGNPDRRLAEAIQLNDFSTQLPEDQPFLLLGDFNIYPFVLHKRNIFYDGDYVEQALAGKHLRNARAKSAFGHFGPLCSINNSKVTLAPFVGPELTGFILDHILVNDQVEVLTHGIDTAKAGGEYPSDHFPAIADVVF